MPLYSSRADSSRCVNRSTYTTEGTRQATSTLCTLFNIIQTLIKLERIIFLWAPQPQYGHWLCVLVYKFTWNYSVQQQSYYSFSESMAHSTTPHQMGHSTLTKLRQDRVANEFTFDSEGTFERSWYLYEIFGGITFSNPAPTFKSKVMRGHA